MKTNKKFLERACNSLMEIPITVGRWSGQCISPEVARLAEKASGAESGSAIGHIKMLGAAGDIELRAVRSHFLRVNTYADTLLKGTTAKNGKGPRIVPVVQVPEVLVKLQKLTSEANQALADFKPRYAQLREQALAALQGLAADVEHKYPTAEALDEKFYVKIGTPRPLSIMDPSKFNLPAGLAASIADRSNQEAWDQVTAARSIAIEDLATRLESIASTLEKAADKPGSGRITDAMIRDAGQLSRNLRDITESWDHDPQLKAMADTVQEKIAAIGTGAKLKESEFDQAEARRAATAVAKQLRKKQEVEAKQAPKQDEGDFDIGGLMGDLL